jgi:hypothetical protein
MIRFQLPPIHAGSRNPSAPENPIALDYWRRLQQASHRNVSCSVSSPCKRIRPGKRAKPSLPLETHGISSCILIIRPANGCIYIFASFRESPCRVPSHPRGHALQPAKSPHSRVALTPFYRAFLPYSQHIHMPCHPVETHPASPWCRSCTLPAISGESEPGIPKYGGMGTLAWQTPVATRYGAESMESWPTLA